MKVFDYFSGKSWWSVPIHFLIIVLCSVIGLVYFFNFYLADYTKHGEVIEVPNLDNLSLEETQIKLEELSLRFEVADTVYSERHKMNAVVYQLPTAGSLVKKNRRVYLTINMPERPKVKITEEIMAKMKRDNLSQVKINLRDIGFEVGRIKKVSSPYKDYVLEAFVGRDTIKVGDEVFLGSKIRLDVGRGQ